MGVLNKLLNVMKLSDDGFDDDEFLDEEVDDYEESRPKKRIFQKLEDDEDENDGFGYDDVEMVKRGGEKRQKTNYFASKEPSQSAQPKSAAPASSKISPIRPKKNSGSAMEVCVMKPRVMDDAQSIANTLLSNCTVVLNMEGLEIDTAQRIIDFASGACFAIGGIMQPVGSHIFIITPANVDVSGDIQEILSGSIAVPNVQSGKM